MDFGTHTHTHTNSNRHTHIDTHTHTHTLIRDWFSESVRQFRGDAVRKRVYNSVHLYRERVCLLVPFYSLCVLRLHEFRRISILHSEVCVLEWWCLNKTNFIRSDISRAAIISRTPFQKGVPKDMYTFYKSIPLHVKQHLYGFSVGGLAGTTFGLVGWGGAAIVIPLLTLSTPVANLSQLSATGVSLSTLSVSTISSGYEYWKNDCVNVPLALLIAIPSMIAARAGTHLARKISNEVLALFFNGSNIIIMPVHFWIQQRACWRADAANANNQPPPSPDDNDGSSSTIQTRQAPLRVSSIDKYSTNQQHQAQKTPIFEMNLEKALQHACFGLCAGLYSALKGIGGLPLAISYITEATHLPHQLVQGTAICAVIPAILTSAFSRIDTIPLKISGWVGIGALFGGYLGAEIALHLSEERLRQLYMSCLVLFGGRSFYGAFNNIRTIYRR